jgi:hypothetical protein
MLSTIFFKYDKPLKTMSYLKLMKTDAVQSKGKAVPAHFMNTCSGVALWFLSL